MAHKRTDWNVRRCLHFAARLGIGTADELSDQQVPAVGRVRGQDGRTDDEIVLVAPTRVSSRWALSG
jgi:hypothetical protein